MTEDQTTSKDTQPKEREPIVPPTANSRSGSGAHSKSKRKEPKRVSPLAYAFLVALTLLAFLPTLQSDLLWSEYDAVERTPYTSMDQWTEAWSMEAVRRHGPVTLTSYFLESYLPFAQPATHRLINILLHLSAALLLLKVLQSLKLHGAYASAIVFALHPAVLQTLFWPGYRNEIVGLVFILASLYFGIRSHNLKNYILTVVLTIIGTLIHPAALVIPAILGLIVFFQQKRFHLYHYNGLLPLFCIALFAGVWMHSGQPPNAAKEEISLLTQTGQNLNFYLRQSLLPFDLELFHKFSAQQSYNVGAANSMLAFLIFFPFYILIAFNYRQRWARGLFLGLSSFLLLLIYGIMETGRFVDGSLAKESHALYVALPAIIALVFCSASAFFGQKSTFGKFLWPIGFGFFILIHLGLTASYSLALSDSARMWQAMTEQWEDSWQPKAALIQSVQSTDSDLLSESETIQTLEELLKLNPERHQERILLARMYREAKQNSNALVEYRYILRETQPSDSFLKEAADFFDSLNLRWEADNVRERINNPKDSEE